jgi:hypothetical protein
MVRGDMDEFFTAWDKVDERVKATQILTLIDKLPGEEKRAARFFYEMLCDYVHPNVGGHDSGFAHSCAEARRAPSASDCSLSQTILLST